MGRAYSEKLINVLRETLRHLDDTKLISQDDPQLLEVKRAIHRVLQEHDAKSASRTN